MSRSPHYDTAISIAVVHKNTDVELIVVTLDRLKIALSEHKSCLSERSEWQVPAGILVTLITTFMTTSFRDVFGLKADYWHAFYTFVTVGAFVWLATRLWKLRRAATMDQLIDRIKRGAQP